MLLTPTQIALSFLWLAIGAAVCSYLQASMWMLVGSRVSTRMRTRYLASVLRQDIAFYDTQATTGEGGGRTNPTPVPQPVRRRLSFLGAAQVRRGRTRACCHALVSGSAGVTHSVPCFACPCAAAGKLLQGLNDDSVTVQQATSEKVAHFVQHSSTFIIGWIVAFVYGWGECSVCSCVDKLASRF